MNRTERLLDLVAVLLAASEPVSFAELREAFPDDYGGPRDNAERKFERDKADLLALGVPIEHVEASFETGRDLGGYRIDRKAFFLPDPKLSPEEAAALYAAGASALATRDFPFATDLAHALRKIALARGDGAQAVTAAARRLLIVRPGDPARGEKLRVLSEAVARRKRVHLAYQAPPDLAGNPGERTERDVDPWGLAFRGGAWRLVGYCHLRRAQRVFVVDRIETLRLNEQRPQAPDFAPPQDFDAGAVAGRKPWQWASAPPATVRLAFAPGSELLGERIFETSGELQVSFLEGLIPQVLTLGDRVSIAEPPAARARVAGILRRMLEALGAEVRPPPQTPDDAPSAQPGPDLAAEVAPDKRERLRRLLLVVPAARRRPGIHLEELARELGLAPEALREDIALLALVGRPPFLPDDLIEIEVDERDRVHVTLDQSFSAPPQLTPMEALALAAACEELASADPSVLSALAKLNQKLTPQARELYASLAKRLSASTPAPRGAGPLLEQLRAAAEARRELVIDYDKEGRGNAEPRRIQPQAVLDHGGRWYVIAQDVDRGAERTFRVDRIRAARESGNAFTAAPLDAARFDRAQLFFPSGNEQPVCLRFSAAAAAWAQFRYGRKARALPDGRADVWIDSAGPRYAVELSLSLAGEAEIVAPAEAREALRDEVARALRLYDDVKP